jgi:hypothetical protein
MEGSERREMTRLREAQQGIIFTTPLPLGSDNQVEDVRSPRWGHADISINICVRRLKASIGIGIDIDIDVFRSVEFQEARTWNMVLY